MAADTAAGAVVEVAFVAGCGVAGCCELARDARPALTASSNTIEIRRGKLIGEKGVSESNIIIFFNRIKIRQILWEVRG